MGGIAASPSLQPRYADSFRCIGSDCEDTCCIGWNVFIDKATYKKYRVTPSMRQAAAELIQINPEARSSFDYASVKLNAENRCPFLSSKNLCNIQGQHGEGFLSQTCARYPRALVRFDGKTQKGLCMSCPEAARLVLLKSQLLPAPDRPRYSQFTLENEQNSGAASSADVIRSLRAFTLEVLQDRSYPIWQRLFLLGTVCRRSRELTAARADGQISRLLAQHVTMIGDGRLRPHLDGIPARPALQLGLIIQLIDRRFQLGQPQPRFAACVTNLLLTIGHSAAGTLLPESAERYQQAYLTSYVPFEQAHPSFMENYLVNYVFATGFPITASFDLVQRSTDPLLNYLLMTLHYRLLHSLLIGDAARIGAGFSMADAIRTVGAFARAIEHNVKYSDAIMSLVNSPELQSTDGLAALLRN